MAITIQYEATIARRGQLTTTVKERTFPSEKALDRWVEKNEGNVTILRYLAGPAWEVSACAILAGKAPVAPGTIYATQGEQLCSCGERFSLCNGPADHARNLAAKGGR